MRFLLVLVLVFCLKQDSVHSSWWNARDMISNIGTRVIDLDQEEWFVDKYVYEFLNGYDVAMQINTGEYKRIQENCDEKQIEYLKKTDNLLDGLSILYNKRIQMEKDDYYKLAEDVKNSYNMVEIATEYTSGIMYCIDKCALKVAYKANSIDQNLKDACERGFRRFHNQFHSGSFEHYMPRHYKDLKKKVEKLETTYKFAVEMLPTIAAEKKYCLDKLSECEKYEKN